MTGLNNLPNVKPPISKDYKMKLLNALVFLILVGVFSLAGAQTGAPAAAKFDAGREESVSRETQGFQAKYVFMSLILPGSGEWFMGNRNTAKFFFGTEFLLWTGYFAANAYVDVLKQDFTAFAAVHAGVSPSGKEDQYWIDIGSSENIYKFNEQKRVERDLAGTYSETERYYWQWDSRENRFRYTDLRLKQHDWKRRVTFVVSGLVLNRLISAIDVIRMIRKTKREEESRSSFLYLNYRENPVHGTVYSLNMTLRW